MSELVDGVVMTIPKDDSLNLPNVHASYGKYRGIFSLKTGKMITGNIPSEKAKRVECWIVLNDFRLISYWKFANKRN